MNTNTPMGQFVRDKPASLQLLGAGKRASTLRARTRAIRTCAEHVVEYLQVRLSEPTCRGGIKGAHQAMCFFEEVSGIAEPDRWTSAAVYLLAKKEILASALPGGVPRQAPLFPTVMLSSLEELVMDASVFTYFRINGWWILLQSWGTLRFSDHRGIAPAQVMVDEQGFTARMTH